MSAKLGDKREKQDFNYGFHGIHQGQAAVSRSGSLWDPMHGAKLSGALAMHSNLRG
jgi:hypothetical protein